MNLLSRPVGFWLVTDNSNVKPFVKKLEAVEYATKTNQDLGFYFFNSVWENFDRSLLGKTSLPQLYAERARQLRDKYDYLVLHYSGGSDSHNVLYTFLKNEITLDEITVRWPKPWLDGKFYTPNNKDTSAKNAPSEYDYAIAPTLKYLQQYHPNIKINVVDFTENIHQLISTTHIENRILDINSSRRALGSIAMRLDEHLKLSSHDHKKVGHIFGIEKPMLFLKDNSLYFYFSDVAFDSILMNEDVNVEPFYWTGDYPLLAMEQFFQVGLFFKTHRQYLSLLNAPDKKIDQVSNEFNLQQNLLKSVLYKESWDLSKFQVNKPNIDRSDWYSWIYESSELTHLTQTFDHVMKNITKNIDRRFLINQDKTPLLAPRRTKLFHLMDLGE